MKVTTFVLIIASCLIITQPVFSQTIQVGLEPLPPLIVDKNNGLTIQLLREVEKISDLKFVIKIMPYNRARNGLAKGNLSLMGHTPHRQEAKEFYTYAQELDWSMPTVIDVYGTNKAKLQGNVYKTVAKIGTPRGNKEFLSELFGIPLSKFYEGRIENLVQMMKAGRIDVFLFERAATMSTIKKLGLKGIYYQYIFEIPVSFAVSKNSEGTKLKAKIDAQIKKVDQNSIFSDYLIYMNLPQQGEVK